MHSRLAVVTRSAGRPRSTRNISIRAQAAKRDPPKNLIDSIGRVISRRGLASNLGAVALFGVWIYLGQEILEVQ
jgi:hypothetical protein